MIIRSVSVGSAHTQCVPGWSVFATCDNSLGIVTKLSLRTSDRCHWCGNPFPLTYRNQTRFVERVRIATAACVIVRLPPAIVHLDPLRYAPRNDIHGTIPCCHCEPVRKLVKQSVPLNVSIIAAFYLRSTDCHGRVCYCAIAPGNRSFRSAALCSSQ